MHTQSVRVCEWVCTTQRRVCASAFHVTFERWHWAVVWMLLCIICCHIEWTTFLQLIWIGVHCAMVSYWSGCNVSLSIKLKFKSKSVCWRNSKEFGVWMLWMFFVIYFLSRDSFSFVNECNTFIVRTQNLWWSDSREPVVPNKTELMTGWHGLGLSGALISELDFTFFFVVHFMAISQCHDRRTGTIIISSSSLSTAVIMVKLMPAWPSSGRPNLQKIFNPHARRFHFILCVFALP